MPIAAHIRFQRFFSTTTPHDDLCWLWTGGIFKHAGYGKFNAGSGRKSNRTVYAHRYAWEIAFGPISSGLLVCHSCDNPLCVRPSHLFLGTQRDNVNDMVSKGRAFWQKEAA